MNKYAQTAIKAADYYKNGENLKKAWEKASIEVFEKGSAAQKKGCPRNAFLGLFDKTNNSKNAQYARKALDYLKKTNSTLKPKELWNIIMAGEMKSHNSQMDIVLVLWEQGFIK